MQKKKKIRSALIKIKIEIGAVWPDQAKFRHLDNFLGGQGNFLAHT